MQLINISISSELFQSVIRCIWIDVISLIKHFNFHLLSSCRIQISSFKLSTDTQFGKPVNNIGLNGDRIHWWCPPAIRKTTLDRQLFNPVCECLQRTLWHHCVVLMFHLTTTQDSKYQKDVKTFVRDLFCRRDI